MDARLTEFVRESNRIEGIVREPKAAELKAHADFLELFEVTVDDLENFVAVVAGADLRCELGMDVRVGDHIPPSGGPDVEGALELLLNRLGLLTTHEAHVAYESLHPFMDGNGRSGRVLWAWQMQRRGQDPFALPFLHRFYYQTLDASQSSIAKGRLGAI